MRKVLFLVVVLLISVASVLLKDLRLKVSRALAKTFCFVRLRSPSVRLLTMQAVRVQSLLSM